MKKSIIIFFLIMMNVFAFSQENYNVFFYGVITPASQDNQKNITQDLFAAQIRILPGMTLSDKRNNDIQEKYLNMDELKLVVLSTEELLDLIPSSSEYKEGDKSILLLSKIDRFDDDKWKCSFYTKNLFNGKIDTVEKEYDTYYKILAEAKNLISEILSISTDQTISAGQTAARRPSSQSPSEVSMSVEGVSGTWSGEDGITKIILMRSGRGFIIFTNGASMNINVAIESQATGKLLKITQIGPFNASYYPDIPRQSILPFAKNAEPIEWNFNLSDSGSLTGIKKTLSLDSDGTVSNASINVSWKKIN